MAPTSAGACWQLAVYAAYREIGKGGTYQDGSIYKGITGVTGSGTSYSIQTDGLPTVSLIVTARVIVTSPTAGTKSFTFAWRRG